ncbi:MAG: LysR family transcriptional regulator [Devosia sp.]|uniref:LysR family transcriptional regulator n=1 Tax=Devosia sp. TaxID=1871048 RepID=UPI001A629B72|nr:LysR family transcriptional regulator [Devosia sp.]MBL8599956.1 LysR family transcriptional regulator [Devosia sp.]
MHSTALRYFLAVAKAGSIRHASENLHVAGSAVSRQIQKLEEELGVALFERTPKGLRLTPAGTATARHAQETLNQFELLQSELGAQRGLQTGAVRVAALDSLFVHLLPAQVLAFKAKHPRVNFHLASGAPSTVLELVAGGDVDIGITFDTPRPVDLQFMGGVEMPLMAMVASGHPLASAKNTTLAECAQFDLLLAFETEPIRTQIEMELSVLDRIGRVSVRSNSSVLLRSLIKSGAGVGFLTRLDILDELEDGSIVSIPLRESRLGSLRLGLLVPRSRQLTQATKTMIECLREGLTALASAVA